MLSKPFDEDEEDDDEEDAGEVDIFIACVDLLFDLFSSVEAVAKFELKVKENEYLKREKFSNKKKNYLPISFSVFIFDFEFELKSISESFLK